MSTALALPDPALITVAAVAGIAQQAQVIREACREREDGDTARELWRRLEAFRRYVTDGAARGALERESRLTEVLIGELLGPAANHGPSTLTTCQGLNEAERHRFPLIARQIGRSSPRRRAAGRH